MNTTNTTQPVRPASAPQGVLFASLPRQLPVLKSGPEDEPKLLVKH